VAPSRSTARPLSAALLAAGLAAALAAVVLARAAAAAEGPWWVAGTGAAGAVALLVIAAAVLTGRAAAVGWGVALLAAAYAIFLVGRRAPLDAAAPLMGVGLVLVAELSFAACEWRGPHDATARVELRRWSRLTLAAAAGGAVGGGALALAAAVPGSVPGLVIGAAGVVALVGVAAWLRGSVAGETQPAP